MESGDFDGAAADNTAKDLTISGQEFDDFFS